MHRYGSICVAAMFALAGCRHPCQVKGSVFIVTEGATNVRLALVDVRAVSTQSVKSYLSGKDQELRLLNAVSQEKRMPSEAKIAEAKITLSAAQENLKRAESRLEKEDASTSSTTYEVWEAARQNVYEARRNVYAAKSELAARQGELPPGIAPSSGPEFYFAGLPRGDANATTDADGHFSLTLASENRAVLIAQASRKVGESVEQYYWVVPCRCDASDQPCILSNNNMNASLASLLAQLQ